MAVAAEQAFVKDPSRAGYILLITDGKTWPCDPSLVDEANLTVFCLPTPTPTIAHKRHYVNSR